MELSRIRKRPFNLMLSLFPAQWKHSEEGKDYQIFLTFVYRILETCMHITYAALHVKRTKVQWNGFKFVPVSIIPHGHRKVGDLPEKHLYTSLLNYKQYLNLNRKSKITQNASYLQICIYKGIFPPIFWVLISLIWMDLLKDEAWRKQAQMRTIQSSGTARRQLESPAGATPRARTPRGVLLLPPQGMLGRKAWRKGREERYGVPGTQRAPKEPFPGSPGAPNSSF